MRRRLTLAVLFVAVPLFAKQRAVRPGDAGHCITGVIARATPFRLAPDEQYVYWIEDSSIRRAPKRGGATQELAQFAAHESPLSMTVGDTHVYAGVQRFDAAREVRLPSAIVAVPKSGGVLSTIVSGIQMPFALETDATHVYWADGGMLKPDDAFLVPGTGAIGRASKDGLSRQTLVADLTAPFALALDGNDVWFGDGETVAVSGLHVVPKSGGAKKTIHRGIWANELVALPTELLVSGLTEDVRNAIFAVRKDGGGVRTLVEDEMIYSPARVFDGVAYFLQRDFGNVVTLWSVPLSGGTPALLDDGLSIYLRDLAVDACAVTVAGSGRTLVRVKR